MRRALLIGINNYPSPYGLNCCVNDVELLDAVLKRHGNGEKNFGVKIQKDPSTSNEIIEDIKNLFHDDADVALFYFSGHGCINNNDVELVTPYELDNRGNYNNGISLSLIMSIARESKVKNKIIILDCCHSGLCGKINNQTQISEISEGISILTACRENECAVENGRHGIFTELLCTALEGGAADFNGNITIGSIYAYIDRSFGEWEQRPIFKTNVSEFVSLRKVTPRVSLDVFHQLPLLFNYENEIFKLDPSFEETNCPHKLPKLIEPIANEENVKKFKILQQLQSIGLVEPHEAPYMYFAAIESKGCKLTSLGKHYWKLVKENQI